MNQIFKTLAEIHHADWRPLTVGFLGTIAVGLSENSLLDMACFFIIMICVIWPLWNLVLVHRSYISVLEANVDAMRTYIAGVEGEIGESLRQKATQDPGSDDTGSVS